MPRNVEIKARCRDFSRQAALAADLADGPSLVLQQQDTFFRVARGRLKLRRLGDGRAELIQYQRPDRPGPSESRYLRVPISDPEALEAALGVRARIASDLLIPRNLTRPQFVDQAQIGIREDGLGGGELAAEMANCVLGSAVGEAV